MTSTVALEVGNAILRGGQLAWVNTDGVTMNEAAPPPALDPPANLIATPLVGSIRLNWTLASVPNTGYRIYASTTDFTPSSTTLVGTVASSVATFNYTTSSVVEYVIKVLAYTSTPAQTSDPVTVLATPLSTSTTDWRATSNLRPTNGKVVYGMYTSTGTSLDTLQAKWGIGINLTRVYTGSGPVLTNLNAAQTALNAGRVPVISINWKNEMKANVNTDGTVKGTSTNVYRYYADGTFDGDLSTGMVTVNGQSVPGFRAVISKIIAFTAGLCPSDQVVITPWHEFENQSESGFGLQRTTQGYTDFRAAWQHFVDLARSMGLTSDKVLWGFCGATGTGIWGENMTDTSSTGCYPGHSYVDIVAWDPYNSSGNGTGRNGNAWEFFGAAGDRGDGHTNTVVNRWGQMSWWFRNFKIGGSATLGVGGNGVYKPVMLCETGTGDYDVVNDPTNSAKRATTFWAGTSASMSEYLAAFPDPIRWVIYFNNANNNVETGSYKPGGFANKGLQTVWARIS